MKAWTATDNQSQKKFLGSIFLKMRVTALPLGRLNDQATISPEYRSAWTEGMN